MRTETERFKHQYGRDIFEVEAHLEGTLDPDYGADRDGRRGEKRIITDDTIEDAWYRNGVEVERMDVPRKVRSELWDQITFFEEWEWIK
jgi:hypothetical protein